MQKIKNNKPQIHTLILLQPPQCWSDKEVEKGTKKYEKGLRNPRGYITLSFYNSTCPTKKDEGKNRKEQN